METLYVDIAIIGGGPGGYTAALHGIREGNSVLLIEKNERLGGTCLNYGCIPSKALLHATSAITQATAAAKWGIKFQIPMVELETLRNWKNSIIEKLESGLRFLTKAQKVHIIHAHASFLDSSTIKISTDLNAFSVKYKYAIIASGSQPKIPHIFQLRSSRIITSTEALALNELPQRLLVVGGGYIGMELGTIYSRLGSEVTIVEILPSILSNVDQDLTQIVLKSSQKIFKNIYTNTKIIKAVELPSGISVTFEKEHQRWEEVFDKILLATGRKAYTEGLCLENTKVELNEEGFIKVNEMMFTTDDQILAIGDVVGGQLLAHKAFYEARIAINSIVGKASFRPQAIPAVIFTEPEIAWYGLTEQQANAKSIPIHVVKLRWSTLGKAVAIDRSDGLTKLILEPSTGQILGVGIVGYNASELIGEGILAVEQRLKADDLIKVIHPHPTLTESFSECAAIWKGASTLILPKKFSKTDSRSTF